MRALTVIERKATMRKHQRSAGDCCSMWYSRRNSRRVGDVNTVIASRSRRRRRCHPLRARRPINSTRLAAHVFTTRYSVVYIPAHQSTEPDPTHSKPTTTAFTLSHSCPLSSTPDVHCHRLPPPNDAGTTTTFFIHRFPTFAFVTSFSRCPYLAMDLRR